MGTIDLRMQPLISGHLDWAGLVSGLEVDGDKGAIRMMSKYLSIKVLCRGHREMLTGYLFIS